MEQTAKLMQFWESVFEKTIFEYFPRNWFDFAYFWALILQFYNKIKKNIILPRWCACHSVFLIQRILFLNWFDLYFLFFTCHFYIIFVSQTYQRKHFSAKIYTMVRWEYVWLHCMSKNVISVQSFELTWNSNWFFYLLNSW